MEPPQVIAAPIFEPLLERLCGELERQRRQLADPLAPQRVLVGTRGMMRWLRAQIATRLGACINVEFDYLASGLARLLLQDSENTTLVTPELLALLLLRLVEKNTEARRHFHALLEAAGAAGAAASRPPALDDRLLGLARVLAEILDRLLVYRPEDAEHLLANKAQLGKRLGRAQAFLLSRLWSEYHQLHQDGRLFHIYDLRRLPDEQVDGARYVHIFGVVSLPPLQSEIVCRLVEKRLARCYLYAPLGNVKEANQPPPGYGLARSSVDFCRLLGERLAGENIEWLQDAGPRPGESLLRLLQDRLRVAGTPAVTPAACDGSVQFHGCHGPTRQVEVLKDRLLELFAANPLLEPRQVLVMTPDIDVYGPLVQEIFSQLTDGTDPAMGRLPVTVVDRGAFAENRFAAVLRLLLQMTRHRVTAPVLLELLTQQPVQERFGLSGSELAEARELVKNSGIRWALDAEDRQQAGQPRDNQNTVAFGQERLATSLVAGDAWPLRLGDTPVAPVAGAGAEHDKLVGLMLRFLQEVGWAVRRLRKARPAEQWRRLVEEVLESLCRLDTNDRNQLFEYQAVLQVMNKFAEEVATAGLTTPLAPQAVGMLFAAAAPSADLAATNAVTVCSFKPMRTVPFPVVCLLGMDAGGFPRRGHPAGEELLQQAGERKSRCDPRAEDLLVFLEGVLSARQSLIVCYTARDAHSNEERYPAGPVELLLDTTAGLTGQDRSQLVTRHPLQSFSPACFAGDGRRRGFSHWAYQAARGLAEPAAAGRQDHCPVFSEDEYLPLSDFVEEGRCEIEIEELIGFFKHPARHLLQKRLGVYLPGDEDLLPEREPIEVGSLEAYILKREILDHLMQAGDITMDALAEAYRARGVLPLGAAGTKYLEGVVEQLRPLAEKASPAKIAAVDIDHELTVRPEVGAAREPVKVRLRGRVAVVADDQKGQKTVREVVSADPQKPNNIISVAIKILALAGQSAGRENVAGEIFGLKNESKKTSYPQIKLAPGTMPKLADLVKTYIEGMCQPLPLPPKAAQAFVKKLLQKKVRDFEAAYREYGNRFGDADEYWQLLFPRQAPVFDCRFARLSESIWKPLQAGLEKQPGAKRKRR